MEIFIVILEVIIIDLILSADNAVLISSVTKNIPKEKKIKVNFFAAIIAATMRALFISLVIFVGTLGIPFLALIGALLLFYIAFSVTKPKTEKEISIKKDDNISLILLKITGTDIFMSFDNAIVIGALIVSAELSIGWEIFIIIISVCISFPIILLFANYFAKLFDKHYIFSYIAMGFLIYIGIELLFMGYYEQQLIEKFISDEWIIRIYSAILASVITYIKFIYDSKHNFDMFIKNK